MTVLFKLKIKRGTWASKTGWRPMPGAASLPLCKVSKSVALKTRYEVIEPFFQKIVFSSLRSSHLDPLYFLSSIHLKATLIWVISRPSQSFITQVLKGSLGEPWIGFQGYLHQCLICNSPLILVQFRNGGRKWAGDCHGSQPPHTPRGQSPLAKAL